eukprot:CAMPEP_0181305728 /NCGR_PEP_ID=MMETSP1101-20121128/9896_1 /TAXON_ID=46948 /ORGANISM="Rhodomonas abbreviata, Strain Caron Lab Isolate" /LENGTH=340 /DNA_ID=CAMNT_0023411687 /DNA_START=151 /DNA_END=1173 /DNA_ORIENTATION=-
MLMHDEKCVLEQVHAYCGEQIVHEKKFLDSTALVGDALDDQESTQARAFALSTEPHTILHVNAAWCSLFGYTAEQAMGCPLQQFQTPNRGFGKNLELNVEGGSSSVECMCSWGNRFTAHQTVVPLQSSAVGVVLVVTSPLSDETANHEPSGHRSLDELVESATRCCDELSLKDCEGSWDEPHLHSSSQSSGNWDDSSDSFDDCDESSDDDPFSFVAYRDVAVEFPASFRGCDVEGALNALRHSGMVQCFEVCESHVLLRIDAETILAHVEECTSCRGGSRRLRRECNGDLFSAFFSSPWGVECFWRAVFCMQYDCGGCKGNVEEEDIWLRGASDLGFLAE